MFAILFEQASDAVFDKTTKSNLILKWLQQGTELLLRGLSLKILIKTSLKKLKVPKGGRKIERSGYHLIKSRHFNMCKRKEIKASNWKTIGTKTKGGTIHNSCSTVIRTKDPLSMCLRPAMRHHAE